MPSKPNTSKRKPGRPRLPPEELKRGNATFRLRDALADQLVAAAQSTGRSFSAEITHRLERSFDLENSQPSMSINRATADAIADGLINVSVRGAKTGHHTSPLSGEDISGLRSALETAIATLNSEWFVRRPRPDTPQARALETARYQIRTALSVTEGLAARALLDAEWANAELSPADQLERLAWEIKTLAGALLRSYALDGTPIALPWRRPDTPTVPAEPLVRAEHSLTVRIDDILRDQLLAAIRVSHRSFSAEIQHRLELSFGGGASVWVDLGDVDAVVKGEVDLVLIRPWNTDGVILARYPGEPISFLRAALQSAREILTSESLIKRQRPRSPGARALEKVVNGIHGALARIEELAPQAPGTNEEVYQAHPAYQIMHRAEAMLELARSLSRSDTASAPAPYSDPTRLRK